METDLLATKVRIPPDPYHTIYRQRLIDILEPEIPHYKLILFSAAAGYGKTTLLTQWANTSQHTIAWLSLSDEDNDLERFLKYLYVAWEEAQPDMRESKLGLLLGSRGPEIQTALTAFINAASDGPGHLVFILDDYHLIDDPAIHDALTVLLDHGPPTLHFVLAGREEPPLPLARHRARSELLEFRAEDLRFIRDETEEFFTRVMGLDPGQDRIESLQDQLEGWIAGLQLTALSFQRRFTEADKVVVNGRHRFIADYLAEDVLAPLDPEMRRFLLQTSILHRLTASLCDAVTSTENSQMMLETLERKNLFLVPLDEGRGWFRYHHLFADFLREELHRRLPEIVADLHYRAAHWYLDHDSPEQAFQHAVDADDPELLNRIFDRYFPVKLLGGEISVLQRWLDAIPEEWHYRYAMIGLARAGTSLFGGQFDACTRCLDRVQQNLLLADREDAHSQLARVTAFRCLMACRRNELERAETLADHALRDLPDEDFSFRLDVNRALGDTYRKGGRWQDAEQCYLKVLDLSSAPTFRVQAVHVFGALADLNLRQGRLRDAAGYWRKALSAIQDREQRTSYPLPLTGWVYIRTSELLYEWDQLAEAWDYLLQGLERAEVGGDVRGLIPGYLLAGRIKLAEGDNEAASEYLERARSRVETAQFSHWISRFERLQIELWLAQDRLRTAVDWSDRMLRDPAVEQRPETGVAQLQLTVALVLIVKGDAASIQQALRLLDRLHQMAEQEGRMGVTIEALVLQALARWKGGERADALRIIERALRQAEPEGYVRQFVDLGLPMARLLQEAQSRNVVPDYVEKLLAAFDASLPLPAPQGQGLPEPLTERELEIVELLVAGLTNPEIAERLVISVQTVKKHTSNIYGKLYVTNRTEAAARARELDILD